MSRMKRTQVTTTEAPAKPATSILVGKTSAKSGHANAGFDLDAAIRARA
jgi:hypothetical protein